jgi:hypothetical protein
VAPLAPAGLARLLASSTWFSLAFRFRTHKAAEEAAAWCMEHVVV